MAKFIFSFVCKNKKARYDNRRCTKRFTRAPGSAKEVSLTSTVKKQIYQKKN